MVLGGKYLHFHIYLLLILIQTGPCDFFKMIWGKFIKVSKSFIVTKGNLMAHDILSVDIGFGSWFSQT